MYALIISVALVPSILPAQSSMSSVLKIFLRMSTKIALSQNVQCSEFFKAILYESFPSTKTALIQYYSTKLRDGFIE